MILFICNKYFKLPKERKKKDEKQNFGTINLQ